MKDEDALAFVLRKATEAEEVLERTYDQSAAEPIFEEVANFAGRSPAARSVLVEALLQVLSNPKMPLELVEYCAHALRWVELREKVEQRLEDARDLRARAALERLLEAFEDDWNQSDIYRRFSVANERE